MKAIYIKQPKLYNHFSTCFKNYQFNKYLKCLYSSQSASVSLKGMHDYYGASINTHRHIIKVATQVAENYGFTELSTPILESTNLYRRGLGEGSEVIVGKELYSFSDLKGEREVALRPEGTAGVMRALVQAEIQKETHRLYYQGPFFRRERPQKGRYRQFHQFGVEQIGFKDASAEVDMISMGNIILDRLGVKTHLKINTLGDIQERITYTKELTSFFQLRKTQLSPLSQVRLDSNPLRILDSKEPQDIIALAEAPRLWNYLGSSSRSHFEAIQTNLNSLGIIFEVDYRLVRGLDYYQHTVWEFVSHHPGLGTSHATVLAGGRYDGLLEKIGGLKTSPRPALGWACGIERLSLVVSAPPPSTGPVLLVSLPSDCQNSLETSSNPYFIAQQLAHNLRLKNIPTIHQNVDSLTKRLPNLLKPTSTSPAPSHLVVIGSTDIESKSFGVKNLANRSETRVPVSEVVSFLISQFS